MSDIENINIVLQMLQNKMAEQDARLNRNEQAIQTILDIIESQQETSEILQKEILKWGQRNEADHRRDFNRESDMPCRKMWLGEVKK